MQRYSAALLLSALAGTAAENCAASASTDPRYCPVSEKKANGDLICDPNAIATGDTVPLRIKVRNAASYEDDEGDDQFVDGILTGGKTIQIAFVCSTSQCAELFSGILVYPDTPKGYNNLAGTYKEAASSSFRMGDAGSEFGGTQMCDRGDPSTACGTITLLEDVPITGGASETIGVVYMFAEGTGSEPSFFVHAATDSAFIVTTGGVCLPEELTASGAGSAQATFASASPLSPPPLPPPSTPPATPPPPPPQCEVCGDAPCSTTCADCAWTEAGGWVGILGGEPSTATCQATCPGCEICKICESDTCQKCVAGEITGEDCAVCASCVICPSPPPPPAPPPEYACIKYNKCHNCEELPAGACLYAGDMEGPCIESCDDLPDEWIFFKKWGACSSACPVSASKDPHLHLPHGGRADFRGQENTVFNLLSAKDVTFNVLFEKGDFAWATRLVHGTKMAAGYWVVKTSSGKTLTVEYTAEKFDPVAVVREEQHQDVQVRAGMPALVVDDVIVSMVGKTLTVRNAKWLFTATTSAYPFGKLEVNKNKVLLDVAVQPLYNPDTDAVAPHGILGQAYDQDKIAVDGKLDEQTPGESTTAAQAEGAIEGSWEDYIVAGKFSTDFKYSRFGLAKAAPRDVSKLTGTKKAAAAGAAVGASDLSPEK